MNKSKKRLIVLIVLYLMIITINALHCGHETGEFRWSDVSYFWDFIGATILSFIVEPPDINNITPSGGAATS